MAQECFQDVVWLTKSSLLLTDISTLKRLFSLKDKFYGQTKSGKPKKIEVLTAYGKELVLHFFFGGGRHV